MQIAFIALCLVGAWVFWRRRRIDPMLLGFASCVFYFAPALAGRIDKPLMGYSAIIAPDVYGVMIIVMLATIATACWSIAFPQPGPCRCASAMSRTSSWGSRYARSWFRSSRSAGPIFARSPP
jgi:hypothetical protein